MGCSIRGRGQLGYQLASNFVAEDLFEEGHAVMPEHSGLMRIFWPLDIQRTGAPGVIVGWKNSEHDLFVVSILEELDVSTGARGRGQGLTDWPCRREALTMR